ncbi:MAG TPA: retropepsin-like aspartic protease [Candidatus Eisenbacteria bacterium]|nr:retropepsin-like aspartic protease [Candidatus Eisenbacteria bacterium]
MSARPARALAVAAGLALTAVLAAADWLTPDSSYRDAELAVRLAAHDTTLGVTAARLDSLGAALIKLARFDEAAVAFDRVLALSSDDAAARAGAGRIALWRDGRVAEAESLLAPAARDVPDARADLYAARLRRGEYAAAAEMAEGGDDAGRAPLLRALAGRRNVCALEAGPERERLNLVRAWPVPLVRARVNGAIVLLAVDSGANELIVDESAARRAHVDAMASQRQVRWDGTRVAARNAVVERLALGGMQLARVPAAVANLHKWSLVANPQGENVGGVIGLELLQRFRPTLDLRAQRLELARPDPTWQPPAAALRVPFQIWGAGDLVVYGTIGGGRRMAMLVATGLPGCALGAPEQVLEEVGLKAGAFSRAMGGAAGRIGGQAWPQVTVPALSVGPLSRDHVPGCAGAMDAGELWASGVRRDAVLGGEFFRGRRITFDWDGRQLVIE